MTKDEEARFEAKAEKMLAGHRGLQDGRDFRWNVYRYRDEQTEDFKKRWDDTFPGSPGSPEWWEKKYGN